MTQRRIEDRDDIQDTEPFIRDADQAAPVANRPKSQRVDGAGPSGLEAATDRSRRTIHRCAAIDKHRNDADRERPLSKIRRSELGSLRARLLMRSVAVCAAILALILFLHFVALPLSENV